MDTRHSVLERFPELDRHTIAGLLWIAVIYLLVWKPEILDALLVGTETLVSTLTKPLEAALMF